MVSNVDEASLQELRTEIAILKMHVMLNHTFIAVLFILFFIEVIMGK